MVIEAFPPLSSADEHGLLAIGGDLDPESLVLAYSNGIFPWPYDDDEPLAWFSPPMRAILPLSEIHISRRLKETLRQKSFDFAKNRNFSAVIRACAESKNRKGQSGTWITEEMIGAYIKLHELGLCDSFEAYRGKELVGGLYGVRLQRFFAAESSFYVQDNASKGALCFMAETLLKEGIEWVDCQVLTPFSRSFGAREIPRDNYITLLKRTLVALVLVVIGSIAALHPAPAHADSVWRCGETYSSSYHEGCSKITAGVAKGITGDRVFSNSRKDKISDGANEQEADSNHASNELIPEENPRISGTLFQMKDSPKSRSAKPDSAKSLTPAQVPSTSGAEDPLAALAFVQCISEALKGNTTAAAKCGLPNLDFSQVTDAMK
jgi:leucyl/phenylalanyl-tRNA--protein transferase